MALNVAKEVAAMERMTIGDLKRKYEEVFGEACRSNHRRWLVKRIIWRMQANEQGGLSERARKRAMELANDADLRLTAPQQKKPATRPKGKRVTGTIRHSHDNRLPMPGTVLTRDYKGRMLKVTVLQDGFEHDGEVYRSLTAVAKAITGSHTSGLLFFGLSKKKGRR